MPLVLPAGPEALTPEWLTSALTGSGVLADARVASVRTEPVGEGVGLLCRLVRLHLTYSPAESGPATMVAKVPSGDAQTREMVRAFGFYEREVRFYRDVAAQVSLAPPASYLNAFDPATGDFAILLEDLGHLRIGDQVAGATVEECETVVRTFGRHHARWWNTPELAALDWMPTAGSPVNKAGMSLYPMALPGFLDRFGDRLRPETVALAERFAGRAGDILDRFDGREQTMCHGDARHDNFFFERGTGGLGLRVLDYQIAIRAPGTYDVGYFMSQSVDTATRRTHERRLLDLYHETLREGGVDDYPRERLLDDYRWTLLFCLAYPVMGGGLGDLANERGVTLARTMADRSIAAIDDWDAAGLI